MPFQIKLEEDEFVERDIDLTISDRSRLRLVLTNLGAYWPRRKVFAIADDVMTRCLPLSDIQQIRLERKSRLGSAVAGLLLVLGGVAMTWKGGVIGWPQALIVGGVILLFVGGRRRVVRIEGRGSSFRWAAPVAFGLAARSEVYGMTRQVAGWARRHSLPLEDSIPTESKGLSMGGRFPKASLPSASQDGWKWSPCCNCGEILGLSRWDHLNGFLVICPHCAKLHGKPWSIKLVLFSSLFLNALSFFFVLRPMRAFQLLALFVAYFSLLATALEYLQGPDWLMVLLFGPFFLGPVLINAILLVRHQMNLGRTTGGETPDQESVVTLSDIIRCIRRGQAGESLWLYIAGDLTKLALSSKVDLGCPDFDEETDEEIAPPGFVERGLKCTIDVGTVADCIKWADDLTGSKDDAAALESIRYYIQNDAFPRIVSR